MSPRAKRTHKWVKKEVKRRKESAGVEGEETSEGTVEEVRMALEEMAEGKATGPDGIHP